MDTLDGFAPGADKIDWLTWERDAHQASNRSASRLYLSEVCGLPWCRISHPETASRSLSARVRVRAPTLPAGRSGRAGEVIAGWGAGATGERNVSRDFERVDQKFASP